MAVQVPTPSSSSAGDLKGAGFQLYEYKGIFCDSRKENKTPSEIFLEGEPRDTFQVFLTQCQGQHCFFIIR